MTKFLNKLFLCGILLNSVNYELAYSSDPEPSTPGQFNITVDFEKNEASTDNNELNTNMDIQYSNTIGKYDTDKYEIKDNILYGKEEKEFCTLNPDAGNYGMFCAPDGRTPLSVPFTTTIQYGEKNYYVFPVYVLIKKNNIKYKSDDTGFCLFIERSGKYIYINNSKIATGNPPEFNSDDLSLTNNVNDTSINIMLVKIGDKYKLSEDCTKILKVEPSPLAKYVTKPGDNTMKWYKTDENGNLPENPAEYKKLNKAIFTITSDGELTLSKSEGGGGKSSLEVTRFGKLVNNGQLMVNSNTSILTPNIILGSEQRTRGRMMELPYYFRAILNLNDVAIDNSNGTLVLKSGSTIRDSESVIPNPILLSVRPEEGGAAIGAERFISMPIIKGGTVDISDFLNWNDENWTDINEKSDGSASHINSAFYNVNIKLLPEKQTNTSDLITYFNDDTKFANEAKHLFKNMIFFSDIKNNEGTVVEARHSTVLIPSFLSVSNSSEDKTKYNTEKPVILQAHLKEDNVLRLFYPDTLIEEDEDFKKNLPLVVEFATMNNSLYEFLNNPAHYINDISVKANTKKLSGNYSLDLSPFVKNDGNVVDYSKFDENGNINLEKIQFVSDKDSKDNLDLTLNPSYVMDGNTKVENTTIDMKSTYDGWKGVITPTSNKIKLSTGTYIIKASKYLSIETEGDVNLYFDNKDKLNLCELSNSNGTLSVFQYNLKENSPLTIKLASDDCIIFPNKATNINAPVSIQFVKDNVMSTKKVYIEIKDLINDYIKAKVAGVTEDINAKYAAISDSHSGVESKLKKINKLLTEIEDNTSKTDYAEYFHKIGEYGITPGCNDVKKYSEIKNVQDKLIKINKLKMEVLEGYLEVLNHYMSTLSDGDGAKTIVQRKIDETKQNISTTKENQIKMLKNKYYITNKYQNMFARNANIITSLAKEITNLSGETFPSVEVDTVSLLSE